MAIEPNSVIAPIIPFIKAITPALTLNKKFEKNRIHNTINNVRPFSALTVGAIYRITQTAHYFDNEDEWNDTLIGNPGIITSVKEGEDDCTKIRVWAPNSLAKALDRFRSTDIVRIRPTGLHTNINTKNQYYTYELSIGDL